MSKLVMDVTILGSGTSTGVPVIGCSCQVCTGNLPKNQRWRSSILIQIHKPKSLNIIIDTTPEFRLQILRTKVTKIDHVLYTHTHADHCFGFDDLRAFYFKSNKNVPCWLAHDHQESFKKTFSYAFHDTGYTGVAPKVDVKTVTFPEIDVDGITIHTLSLPHGNMQTVAYRIGGFAYATDFKLFPPEAIAAWKGKVHTMVSSAVHYRPHPTHSNIGETIELFNKLEIKRGYLTHLSHEVDFYSPSNVLPKNIEFAYDSLSFSMQE